MEVEVSKTGTYYQIKISINKYNILRDLWTI